MTDETELQPEAEVTNDEADNLGDAYDRAIAAQDRDEFGRFVSKAPAEAASPAPAAGEGAGASDAPSSPAVASAPAHLPQAIKAHWDKYTPEAQAAIATHQAEIDRKFGEIGKQYGTAKPVYEKIIGAAQQYPEFQGMSPDQIADGAIQLAAVQARMERGPDSAVATLMEVAKAYNVLPQLAKVFNGQAPQGDNQVAQLQQHIARLEQQIARAGNPEFIREQITSTMTERETETAVRSFASGKEHWADVEAYIPRFIQVVQGDPASEGKSVEEILTDAYDMATNALPAVREKLRAAEAAKATAAAANPARTAQARKAASINVKSTSSGERQLTELEAMSSAYDRAMAN